MINSINNTLNIPSEIEQTSSIEPKSKAFLDIKTRLQGIIEDLFLKEEKSIDEQIQDKFLNLDFAGIFDVNADKIGVNDAIFFINLLNQENVINYNVENASVSLDLGQGKTIKPTSSLMEVLNTSISQNKPVRLDFDNDVTVILKMDNKGKIQTHFLPGSAEVEAYLKNNLQCLKQAFDEQEINYSSLSYSRYKNPNNSKKEKRGKEQ